MRDIFSGIIIYLVGYAGYQWWMGDFPANPDDIAYSIGLVIGEAIRWPYDAVVSWIYPNA